jgi:hypothetical protein
VWLDRHVLLPHSDPSGPVSCPQVLLLPPDAPPALHQATSLVAAILGSSYVPPADPADPHSAHTSGVPQRMSRCTHELQQLLALYSSASAPALSTLRHPLLLELLVQVVFPAAGQQAPQELQQLAVSLLALAVAASQEGSGPLDRRGPGCMGRPCCPALDPAALLGEPPRQAALMLPPAARRRSSIQPAAASITSGARLVQRAVQGLRLAPDELAAAAQAARVRVVALGWLHSIGSHTAQREYHSEDRAGLAYTACVALLEHVLQLHPHLHERVRAARRGAARPPGAAAPGRPAAGQALGCCGAHMGIPASPAAL